MSDQPASARLASALDIADKTFSDYPTLDGGCVQCGCELMMQYHYADGRGVPNAPFEMTDSNGKVISGKTSKDGVFKATNIGCGTYEVLFDEGEDEFTPQETYANNPTLQANPEYAALATEYFTLFHHLHQKGLVSVSSGGWTDFGDEDLSHDIDDATDFWGTLKAGFTQDDVNAVKRFRELADQVEDDDGALEAAIIKTHHQFAGEAADSNMAIMMVAEIILGCIPVVGNIMDVKDCAVWVYDGCTGENGGDFSDPLYLGMGALSIIGFIPGLGDAIKKGCMPIIKFLRKADDVSGVMRKIRKLSNGSLIQWLIKIKNKIAYYANKAIEVAANIAVAFSKLVAKVKRWVPQWLLDILNKVDGYIQQLEKWIDDAISNIKRWVDDFIGKIFTKKTGVPQKKGGATTSKANAGADADINNRQKPEGESNDANGKRDNDPPCSCATPNTHSATAHPIRIATGQVADHSTDVIIPGLPALRLSRVHHPETAGGLLGKHWHTNLDAHLRVEEDSFWYIDEHHSEIQFYDPNPGEQRRNTQHPQERLCRDNEQQLYILNSAGERHYFGYALGNRLLLSAIVDRNGNRIDVERRVSDGFIAALHRNDGHSLFFSGEITPHEHQLRLSAVRHRSNNGKASKLLFYRYDDQQRLNHIDGQLVEGWSNYHYNDHGQITRRSDEHSVKTYQYNDQGRVIAQDGSDHHNQTRYHYQRGKTVVDTPSGGQHTYHYDSDGHTTRFTDSLGATTELLWQQGQHLGNTDPLGRVIHRTFDDWGEIIATSDANGPTETIDRDEHGRPRSITNSSGHTWYYGYDERGNLISVTDPLDQCQHIVVNEHGLPTQITFPEGGIVTYTYNAQRQLISQTDPNGHRQTYHYDALGRLQQHIDAEGHRQYWDYTEHSHLMQPSRYTDPQGQQWHSHYSAQGRLTKTVDPNGHSQHYHHGAFDTLSHTTDASGHQYHFHYGPNSRLERISNPQGDTWHNHYDTEDRVIRTQDFGGTTTFYSYDKGGRMIQRQTPDGCRHDYQYDDDDHLIQKTIHLRDGTTQDTHYTYNDAGLLACANNGHANVELDYDILGRLIAETINGHRVERQYNADGLCEHVHSPHYQQQRQYNPAGQLQQLTLGDYDPLHFAYNARGQEVRRHSPQGFGLQQDYTARGQLKTQHAGIQLNDTSGTLQHAFRVDRQYAYDNVGQLSQRNDKRWGSSDYHHTPNGYISRLINRDSTGGIQQEHFDYTSTGDISSTLHPPVEHAVQAANGDNIVDLNRYRQQRQYTPGGRVETIGTTTYRYNASGQRTEKTEHRPGFRPKTWRYHWDGEGQLAEVHTPDNTAWQYHYDPFGRRISKVQKHLANNLHLSGDHTIGEHYHWHNHQMIQVVPQYADGTLAYDHASAYHYQGDSLTPVAQERQGQLHYFVTDQVGTPTESLNEQGDILWRGHYSLWGELRQQDTQTNIHTQTHTAKTDLRFMGQWYDEESGLHYNRFRYYDPETAQYLSPDPIGLQGGLTPQAYVHNPTGWVDPLGLCACKVDGVIEETLSGEGNITSIYTLNSDEALDAGLKHVGPGYTEIGRPGSGVFRSADGTKQFRIDDNSLSGNHPPNVPHFHLETYEPGARRPTTNNHIPLVD